MIRRGGKAHYVGTFDTPEKASATVMFVKNELARAKLSALGADDSIKLDVSLDFKPLAGFGHDPVVGRELERCRPIALVRHHVSRHHRRCLEGGISRLRRIHDRETALPDRKREDVAVQGPILRIDRHRAARTIRMVMWRRKVLLQALHVLLSNASAM